jgi:hypothetical protein
MECTVGRGPLVPIGPRIHLPAKLPRWTAPEQCSQIPAVLPPSNLAGGPNGSNQADVGAGGYFHIRGLLPGEYRGLVLDQNRNTLYSTLVSIRPGMPLMILQLPESHRDNTSGEQSPRHVWRTKYPKGRVRRWSWEAVRSRRRTRPRRWITRKRRIAFDEEAPRRAEVGPLGEEAARGIKDLDAIVR